jgi:23S rRNA (uracil1939-C5)-methyltransferase
LDAFMQVNTSVNRSLCATVRALAVSHRVVSAIDLYAGSGNLTLPLLREGVLAAAVESQASAIHALRLAAEAQGFEGFEIFAGDARAEAEALAGRGRRWDLVVVDAPRAGVREGLSNMARLASRYMALVSCNPGTLARDLSILEGCGFGVRELYLFDMFAQTRHVEVLAWLSRK